MITYISNADIVNLHISPVQCLDWVREALLLKSTSLLPPKTSIAYGVGSFLNTMPVVVPPLKAMGVKIVNRYPERTPSISGQILYYDYETGSLTHILDAAWITTARTGAVCATAVNALAVKDVSTIGIMGLGNTGHTSMACILESNKDRKLKIKVLDYKDHAQKFIADFSHHENVSFEICTTMKDLIEGSDVVISCVTYAPNLLAEPEWFKPGCLLVPVHTRGFQNCDYIFDKIFGDDTAHISHFHYFKQFKKFAELGDVLQQKNIGRETSEERIIAYNIGLALHDIVYCNHIIQLLTACA